MVRCHAYERFIRRKIPVKAKRSWPIQIHRNCYYSKCSKWEWRTRTRTWFVTSGHKTNFFPKISIFDFDKVKWLSVESVCVLVLTSLFIGSIIVFKWHKRKQKYFITNSNGLNFKYIWLEAFDLHMLFPFYCLFAYYSALDVLDDFNSPVFTAKLVKQKDKFEHFEHKYCKISALSAYLDTYMNRNH